MFGIGLVHSVYNRKVLNEEGVVTQMCSELVESCGFLCLYCRYVHQIKLATHCYAYLSKQISIGIKKSLMREVF